MANIRDIAKHAGVSVATVSRTLSQPGVVRQETLDRVKLAIAEMSYRPNRLASGLRRARSMNILVAVPHIDNPFYAGIIQGIEATAHENGYKLLLGETRNDQARLDGYAEMVMSKEADGLVLLSSLLPGAARERAASTPALPIVMACEYVAGFPAPTIRIDNRAAAAAATQHLLALGHRNIAHIAGPAGNILSLERLAGCRARLEQAGLKLPESRVARGDFSLGGGYRAMSKLLGGRVRPTGVFCCNDEMAIGAMRAIADAGLHVPDDISLVGFDDLRFAGYATPALTTMAQPALEMGQIAMQMMLSLIEGTGTPASDVVLPHALVKRASTAAPRR